MEISQLYTAALGRVIEDNLWDKSLLDQVREFTRVEETSSVYLSKLKESEE
jgi:hypothetical protein